jgi:hypothetical protein
MRYRRRQFMRWYHTVVTLPGSESGFIAANVRPLLIPETARLANRVPQAVGGPHLEVSKG